MLLPVVCCVPPIHQIKVPGLLLAITLATRFNCDPGTPVTLSRLSAVEKAEKSLKNLGFSDLRVRHYEKTARLEVPVSEIEKVLLYRQKIVKAVQSAGYLYVTLDLEGLRSGNLNQELQEYD